MHGYGRHTKEEGGYFLCKTFKHILNFAFFSVFEIGKADLKAIEDFIGNKKYLFGDSPIAEDAVIFSFTCHLVYYDNVPLNKYLTSTLILN